MRRFFSCTRTCTLARAHFDQGFDLVSSCAARARRASRDRTRKPKEGQGTATRGMEVSDVPDHVTVALAAHEAPVVLQPFEVSMCVCVYVCARDRIVTVIPRMQVHT